MYVMYVTHGMYSRVTFYTLTDVYILQYCVEHSAYYVSIRYLNNYMEYTKCGL